MRAARLKARTPQRPPIHSATAPLTRGAADPRAPVQSPPHATAGHGTSQSAAAHFCFLVPLEVRAARRSSWNDAPLYSPMDCSIAPMLERRPLRALASIWRIRSRVTWEEPEGWVSGRVRRKGKRKGTRKGKGGYEEGCAWRKTPQHEKEEGMGSRAREAGRERAQGR